MKPVAAKLHLQPKRSSRMPINGTPIAEANFAAASKMAVARLLSCLGNQYPIAFALAGKVGASPIPSKRRAAKKPPIPLEIAAPKEAMLQRIVLTRPTRRTPKRSSNKPDGIWSRAYVQLYALNK